MNAPCLVADFETRSAVSLRKSGAWRYSIDETTEVLCLGFRLPSWEEERTALWHPEFSSLEIPEAECPELPELVEWIIEDGLVSCHNAFFERSIWTNILTPKYGFPLPQPHQWRDSAAKAAAHALPRSLEDAVGALGLDEHKDAAGHKLMLKLSKPRKPRKKEREAGVTGLLWWESQELFEQLWAYCIQDVLAEASLSAALPDLNEQESALYVLDQQINERGFQLDQEAVTTALTLINRETLRLNAELKTLTNGQVAKATQRAQMLRWFEGEGLDLEDTQAATISEVLANPRNTLRPDTKRGLEILSTLGKSSTAKYEAMQNWMAPDGRIRGGLIYHGATTGRWTGAGVQPHNFVRGTVKDMDVLWDALKLGRGDLLAHYGGIMDALSQGLRGAIVSRPGSQLYVADYSAIEARVVMWLAGQEDALDIFRRGEDIYLDMASTIYHRVCTKADTKERQLGKATILGCGFQMGASRFVDTAATYGITIDEDFSKGVVDAYRAKYSKVKTLWYDMEQAAVDALHRDNEGIPVECGKVEWLLDGRFLYCILPSGRRLAYPGPQLTPRKTPWGETRMQLSYMGVDAHTRQWKRQTSYGGLLTENVTQACARDILAEALTRLEASGTYRPVLSIHDEIVSEASLKEGSVAEYEALVTENPDWADGLPIAGETWHGTRYRK